MFTTNIPYFQALFRPLYFSLSHLYNNLKNKALEQRTLNALKQNSIFFLPLFLYVAGSMLFQTGYSYDVDSYLVTTESMKLLHNLMAYPLLGIVLLLGVSTLLYAIYTALFKTNRRAVWLSGLGTVLTVTVLLFILGINHTVYYPSLADLQSSLTIENSSGSHYTLFVMGIVSLLVPVVLGYIFLVWRSMDKTKMTIEEVKADTHHY